MVANQNNEVGLLVYLIAGTRRQTRRGDAERFLDGARKPDVVIVGDAGGIDLEVRNWCKVHSVSLLEGIAVGKWPEAGPRRNRVMALVAAALQAQGHEVLAFFFPDEQSTGTPECKKECKRCKIPCEEPPRTRAA